MRAFETRKLILLAALAAAAGLLPSPAVGQGGMGGMPNIPQSMFGQRKERDTEVHGPSLSATDEPVAEIRIHGNKTIPTTQILNQLQTRVGRPFDPALVQRDVRKLASRSWFLEVKPTYEQAQNGRVVIFTVVERPVIRYVAYLGNKGIREKKLKKETGLTVGGSVDPDAVEEARRKLLDLYHRSGYNHAQVTIREGNKTTDQGVVFIINEGTPQKVWKVNFVGNEFVSGRRLKTQIESKPPLGYIFKGYVDMDQINGDVDRLTAYYRSFGYFEAKIGRQIEYGDSGKWATVTFVVHEGPRYTVEEVAFIGNKIISSSSLAMDAKMPAGEYFEQLKMNADVEALKEIYGSDGYVFADIQAEPIFLEEPGKLKLMYHIEEGKQWRVGNVYVRINGDTPHTRIQTALNRLSIRPGEIVDIREVHASERRLQASQLFMADPARGIMPKITYRIQELDETELADQAGGGTFRGQSPDQFSREQGAGSGELHLPNSALLAPRSPLHAPATAGPPLIAPPGSKLYIVEPPTGFVRRDDQVDVMLDVDSGKLQVVPPRQPATSPSSPPTARRYEVRYQPSQDNWTDAYPQTTPPVPQAQEHVGNPYQQLVVRTQSPISRHSRRRRPPPLYLRQPPQPPPIATAPPPTAARPSAPPAPMPRRLATILT